MTIEVNRIYTGDCIEVMKTWPPNFVDTIITDPPYGLDFMGKDWDGDVPGVHFWTEMLRVCKPGAMLLTFGGTRTWHHLATAIERAGWQIRDCLMWLYGSGFPKSLDISKAIDKAKGAEREVLGYSGNERPNRVGKKTESFGTATIGGKITEPQTDLSRQWSGYGTALKPAWEPIIVAMKPLDGTFAENAERWGVAGLNVDGGRVAGKLDGDPNRFAKTDGGWGVKEFHSAPVVRNEGRWPANLILDEEAAGMLDGVSGASSSNVRIAEDIDKPGATFALGRSGVTPRGVSDSGGASRFFYVAKSARAERNEGCEDQPDRLGGGLNATVHGDTRTGRVTIQKNNHPTVKPLSLMKYLCQLTRTPTGGIVLDPFAGSGTTLWAAEFHNRPWLGIELSEEYVKIAEARIARERSQLKMAI